MTSKPISQAEGKVKAERSTKSRRFDPRPFFQDPIDYLQTYGPTSQDIKRLFGMACGKQKLDWALLLIAYWLTTGTDTPDNEVSQQDHHEKQDLSADAQHQSQTARKEQDRQISDLDLEIKNMIMHLICQDTDLACDDALSKCLEEQTISTRPFSSSFWEQEIQDLVRQVLSGPIKDEKLITLGIRFYCSVGRYEEGKTLFGNLMNSGEQPHIRTFLPLLESSPDLTQLHGWHRLVRQYGTKEPTQDFYEVFFRKVLELSSGNGDDDGDDDGDGDGDDDGDGDGDGIGHRNQLFLEVFEIFCQYHMYVSPEIARVLSTTWALEPVDIRPDGRVFSANDDLCGRLEDLDISEQTRREFVDTLYNKHEVRLNTFDQVMRKRGFTWDVVFDGANIALYNNSEFRPDRILRLGRWAMKRGWKALLILHTKRRHQVIEKFVQEHSSQIQLFYTPIGFNDDHYWIYAALSRHCYVVSNDEMRDHLFQNFDSTQFKVWKERHRITYHFDREQNGHTSRGSNRNRGSGGRGNRGGGRNRGNRGGDRGDRGGGGSAWKAYMPPRYSRRIQLQNRDPDSKILYLPIYDVAKWGDDYLQNLDKIEAWYSLTIP